MPIYNPAKPTVLDAVSDFRCSNPRQFFTFTAVGIAIAVIGLAVLMNF